MMKTVQDGIDWTEGQGSRLASQHRPLKHFHKFRPQYYSYKMMRTGWILRTLTAAILMMVIMLAPVGMTRSLAAPAADPQESMGAESAVKDAADIRTSRGESRLTKRQRAQLLAWALLRRTRTVEPVVTADMKTLEQGSARLQGLEYRLKDEDSLMRKILADAEEQEISLDQAAAGIHDVLRYTLVCRDDSYSQDVPAALTQLTAKGYTVMKFRNAWGGKFYQGVNVQLLSPEGVPVELQFHTAQSFAIKQASHEVYEIRRSPQSTPAQIAEATRQSLAYNAQVIVPAGAKEIHWNEGETYPPFYTQLCG